MASQPDGAFPRVNLAMIKSGNYNNLIVSLVCRLVEYNGEGIMQVECSDGGAYNVQVDEGYEFTPNKVVEIMGHLQDGETPLQVSLFLVVCFSWCCSSCTLLIIFAYFSHLSRLCVIDEIMRLTQHFVTREIGNGQMALDVYNDMITQVYTNHKYKDLFNPM